jgi:hypothetical protein
MPELNQPGLPGRVQLLRAELAQRDLVRLARMSGARLLADRLLLDIWQVPVTVRLPDFVAYAPAGGGELDLLTQAMVAYYLHTTDGTPPAGAWIAFTDLPDGRFYTQAFQGYTGRELARRFGNDLEAFGRAALACGARPGDLGDATYQLQALPHVPILAVAWQGDEDFPPSYQVLFDAHTHHHLPTDACAILGSMFTRRLLASPSQRSEQLPGGPLPTEAGLTARDG